MSVIQKVIATLFSVAIVLLLSLFRAPAVLANEVVFSEDFSTDFHRWEPLRDTGSQWQIIDGKADVALHQAQTISELVPKDEFWNSNWKNLEYSLDYTPLVGIDRNISFNVQNSENWYEIHFVDTFFNLVRLQNNTQPFDVYYPFVMENGRTYHITIKFDTGLIQVFCNHILIAQEFDSSFTTEYGKIGIKVSTGEVHPTRVQFDNIQVKLLTETSERLLVPLYKQNNPLWGNFEYDTAQRWSTNPTISRWGCAVTSAAMIFRYHGIHWLPNGEEITPLTLNQWLLSQSDGYLGEGLVNWVALTRLSKLSHMQKGTTKLEYSRADSDIFSKADTSLTQNQPVIFEVPGHFVVGTGMTFNKHDAWINDPFYSYDRLSQHSVSPKSIRFFKPSQTDLSYLLITLDTPIPVFLVDENHEYISEVETYTEYIQSSENSDTTKTLTILQLAKPSSRTYNLYLVPTQTKSYQLSILAYDVEGNVTQNHISAVNTETGTHYQIPYQKEVILPNTWQHFLSVLEQTFAYDYFFRYLSYYQLKRIAMYALEANLPQQLRYTYLVLEFLTTFEPTIDSKYFLELKTILLNIQDSLIAASSQS